MQKGTTLILSVLILSIIMAIALGTTAIFIGEISISGQVGRSMVAIYAADAGIECFLYRERRDPLQPCEGTEGLTMPEVSYLPFNIPPAPAGKEEANGAAKLKSIGVFGATRRGLEVRYCEVLGCTPLP